MKTRTVLSMAWPVVVSIVLISVLLVPSLTLNTARAAGPWYVAPGGNDFNSCLSPASPCATINGAIAKASSGDTIYVATGVYTSSSGTEVVLIDRTITLSGGWNPTFTTQSNISTLDGSGERRGIYLNSGITANIVRFAIQGGSGTYGIENSGTLALHNSTVSDNNEGGIYSEGTLTLNNTTVSGNSLYMNSNGGAIRSLGALTLNNSTVMGNDGVGIISSGPLTLNNTTVSGNTGYGIDGLVPLILNNSTVSDNLIAGIFLSVRLATTPSAATQAKAALLTRASNPNQQPS
jgi:hypothetical protein